MGVSEGKVKLGPRTEADHSKLLSALQLVADLRPWDDAPGDRTGDLADDHRMQRPLDELQLRLTLRMDDAGSRASRYSPRLASLSGRRRPSIGSSRFSWTSKTERKMPIRSMRWLRNSFSSISVTSTILPSAGAYKKLSLRPEGVQSRVAEEIQHVGKGQKMNGRPESGGKPANSGTPRRRPGRSKTGGENCAGRMVASRGTLGAEIRRAKSGVLKSSP